MTTHCSFHPPRPPPPNQTVHIEIMLHDDDVDLVLDLIHDHEGHRHPDIDVSDGRVLVTFFDPPGLEPALVRQLIAEIKRLECVTQIRQLGGTDGTAE